MPAHGVNLARWLMPDSQCIGQRRAECFRGERLDALTRLGPHRSGAFRIVEKGTDRTGDRLGIA